jgi:Flp pilus assembly pilin Flp
LAGEAAACGRIEVIHNPAKLVVKSADVSDRGTWQFAFSRVIGPAAPAADLNFLFRCRVCSIEINCRIDHSFMRALFRPFRRKLRRAAPGRRKGQTLVEYSLVLAVLTILALGVFSAFSQRIVLVFSGINAILDTDQGS